MTDTQTVNRYLWLVDTCKEKNLTLVVNRDTFLIDYNGKTICSATTLDGIHGFLGGWCAREENTEG